MKPKYIITILVLLMCSGTASAWLPDYNHRIAITVNNGGASTLTNYQFNFTNDTNTLVAAGHMQASGADCRITDVSDNLIPFWNETAFNAVGTKIWANATTLEVGDNTFYMYYGNTGASSVASGTNTFDFFDDFMDGTYTGDDGIVSDFGNWNNNRASYIVGNYAYVTELNGMHVVDISDINNPSVIGYVALGTQTLDIEMGGNYAYVSVLISNKLSVVNITNKTNPVEVGSVTDATKLNQIHGINKSGDYIYCCAYASGGANGYFTIVNVSDPTNPTIEGWVANNASNYIKGSHDVRVIGDYAYLIASDHHVDTDGRFTIINVSNKSSPFVVSSITGVEFERSADIQIKGNYAFFGQWGYPIGAIDHRYFRVVDISDVNNPFLAGGLEGYNMYIGYIYGDLIYCSDSRWDTITVIDISTPTSPSFVKQYTIPGATAVLHVFLTEDGAHGIAARYNSGAQTDKFYIFNTSVIPELEWYISASETGDTASATTTKLIVEKGGTTGLFQITKNSLLEFSDKRFWECLVEYPTGKRCELQLNGDNANPTAGAIHLIFDTSGVRYYDTAYHTICTMDADTEYKISVVPNVSANTFNFSMFYGNGTEVSYSGAHTGLNFRNSATYINQWGIKEYAANSDKGIYDNFLIRNYTATEPTSSLGAEEDAPAGGNDITIPVNAYGFLRKDVTAAQTFSTIAGEFAHEICFSWLNNSGECWESYWSGDAYNSDLSIPKHDAYFVLMDGTGETVSCGVRAAGNVAIPTGWYATYLGESTAKTLTQIKTDIQVDGDVTNLYTWDHNAGGTGAWVSVDVTPSHSVLPNQGILINNMGAPYNWDGAIS